MDGCPSTCESSRADPYCEPRFTKIVGSSVVPGLKLADLQVGMLMGYTFLNLFFWQYALHVFRKEAKFSYQKAHNFRSAISYIWKFFIPRKQATREGKKKKKPSNV